MNEQKPTILITGATGFAGCSIAQWFIDHGYRVIGAARRPVVDARAEYRQISRIDRYTFWEETLKGADVVIHLAARAHQVKESAEARQLYYETNVEGTENLARQAFAAGVKHFIFISSTKAMIGTSTAEVLNEATPCCPADPYGISKYKAELELAKISSETGLPVTILRPPLMYGPGVKGNMASLIKLVRRLGYLPLGGINNQRSLLGIKNLASAIEAVINNPVAHGKTYLVSDGERISTSELTRRLAETFNRGCRILPLPAWLWKLSGKIPWLSEKFDKLTGSLAVDSALIESELGWKPPFTMQQQLDEMKLP